MSPADLLSVSEAALSPRRVVIIGYGMAGARLAEEIRRRDPGAQRVALTVLGAERHPAYNRVLLSSVVAGSLKLDAMRLHEPDWAQHHGVDLRLDTVAAGIDRAGRATVLADGSRIDFDALVLATGSRPWIPPVEGLVADDGSLATGAVAFRNLDDCRVIVEQARAGAPVVVLGGGLLGLEAARGLSSRGAMVTVLHPVGHLMERQLDPAAGRVLARTLGELGINVRLNVLATKYVPGDGLKLDDGSHLPADLVVVAAGVHAETSLAADAGLAVDRGVVVDDALCTSDPRVHALGDCAQHAGTLAGFVQPAWEQAVVLADLLTGSDPAARYRGTPVVTRLKARDIDLAALGEVHIEVDCADAEVLRLEDPMRGRYAKLVLRGERVTGAILLGAPDAAAVVTQLYDRATPAPRDRLALLLGRAQPTGGAVSAGDLPPAALVCRCNTVNKSQLIAAWGAGGQDMAALVTATRATTGCGTCREQVAGIAEWLADQDADEQRHRLVHPTNTAP